MVTISCESSAVPAAMSSSTLSLLQQQEQEQQPVEEQQQPDDEQQSHDNQQSQKQLSQQHEHQHHQHQQQHQHQQPILTVQQREMQEKHGAIIPTVHLTFADCKKLKSFIKDYSYNCGKSIKINNNSQAVTYLCSDSNCQWKIIAVKPRSDRTSTSTTGSSIESTNCKDEDTNSTTTTTAIKSNSNNNNKGQFKITKVHNVHSFYCSSISKLPQRQQRLLKQQQAQAGIRVGANSLVGQNQLQSLLVPTYNKGRGRPKKQIIDETIAITNAATQQVPALPSADDNMLATTAITASATPDMDIARSHSIVATHQQCTHSDGPEECAMCKSHTRKFLDGNVNEDDVDDDGDKEDDTTGGSGLPVILSNGPFTALQHPIVLSIDNDNEFLNPIQCYIRKHCTEVFTAALDDVTAFVQKQQQQSTTHNITTKGNNKTNIMKKSISVGQIGIRCSYCHSKQKSLDTVIIEIDDTATTTTNTNGCKSTITQVPKQPTSQPLPPFAQPYQVSGSLAGSVCYPTTIRSIYPSIQDLIQNHFINCSNVPRDVMKQYEILRVTAENEESTRSSSQQQQQFASSMKRYWEASAACLGLVDTLDGVRYSSLPPPSLQSIVTLLHGYGKTMFSEQHGTSTATTSTGTDSSTTIGTSNIVTDAGGCGIVLDDDLLDAYDVMGSSPQEISQHHRHQQQSNTNAQHSNTQQIVIPDDKPYSTLYSYLLMDQIKSTIFTDADRISKRYSLLPNGFPGLACKHCGTTTGSTSSRTSPSDYNANGRFFPSTLKVLADSSKTLNVIHNHIMRCCVCPIQIREALDKLRYIHDDERSTMEYGSHKKFFQSIWDRLHSNTTATIISTTTAATTASPSDIIVQSTNTTIANSSDMTAVITADTTIDTYATTDSNVVTTATTASSTDVSDKVDDVRLSSSSSLSLKRSNDINDTSPPTSNKQRKVMNTAIPI